MSRPAQYERETAHHQSGAKMYRHPEIEENELERPTNQPIHRSAAKKWLFKSKVLSARSISLFPFLPSFLPSSSLLRNLGRATPSTHIDGRTESTDGVKKADHRTTPVGRCVSLG